MVHPTGKVTIFKISTFAQPGDSSPLDDPSTVVERGRKKLVLQ
jgi:hypothetical protein